MKTTDKMLVKIGVIASAFLLLVLLIYFFYNQNALDGTWKHTYFPLTISIIAILTFVLYLPKTKKK